MPDTDSAPVIRVAFTLSRADLVRFVFRNSYFPTGLILGW